VSTTVRVEPQTLEFRKQPESSTSSFLLEGFPTLPTYRPWNQVPTSSKSWQASTTKFPHWKNKKTENNQEVPTTRRAWNPQPVNGKSPWSQDRDIEPSFDQRKISSDTTKIPHWKKKSENENAGTTSRTWTTQTVKSDARTRNLSWRTPSSTEETKWSWNFHDNI
jgi:hypothetical protein